MADYKSHFPVPIAKNTQVVFFEPTPGHSYLFDLYGHLPGVQFVGKPGYFWEAPPDFIKSFLAYNEQHLSLQIRAMVFLTADMFLHTDAFPLVLGWLEHKQQRTFGFLHELPADPDSWKRLQILGQRIHIIVLSEEMKRLLHEGGVPAVSWLPHHPVHYLYQPENGALLRDRFGIPRDAFVATFLGELRHGKGIELILDSLEGLGNSRVFLNFAGKGTHYAPVDLGRQCRKSGIPVRLNVSRNTDLAEYRVMSDQQYARELFISDALLLPYVGRQSRVMSGVLPDAIHFGVPVLCTKESMVGQEVERFGLGQTFSATDPSGFSTALGKMSENEFRFDEIQQAYLSRIDPSHVLETLASILQSP